MRPAPILLACALAATLPTAPRADGIATPAAAAGPLTLVSARVSVDGTSNIHAFTASTTDVRLGAVEISGTPGGALLAHVLQPGALTSFEIVIPAATLTSPKDGIDKNMHKALKVLEHPDIRFQLRALEPAGDAYRAAGALTIAGVEREVAVTLQVQRNGTTLAVTGGTDLLMTDFGITPPRAMLGVLRTDPRVRITIELLLGTPLT